LATGRRTYEPIRFTKRIDKSSPLLARAAAQGTHIPKVELSIDGRVCVLSDAVVVSVSSADGVETVSFNYQKIEWRSAAPGGSPRSEPVQRAPEQARPSGVGG